MVVERTPQDGVTLCFTDIESSTALVGDLGAERYEVVLERHRHVIRDAFAPFGGVEVKHQGDGMFFVFSDAAAAITASEAAQRALVAEEWPFGVMPRVRIGLHTGAATRTADGDYIGYAVHQAARVANAANGGQVVVSPTTAAAAATAADPLVPLGLWHVRDFPGPVVLRAVPGDTPSAARPPRVPFASPRNFPAVATSFLGREHDIAVLTGLVVERPLVTLVGAGGVGKTRLALEVGRRVTGEFRDGVWLVELGGVDPAATEMVASAIASALGTPVTAPVEAAVIDDLVGSHRLVVLDACEHVLDAVAGLVDAVSRRDGRTRFLATSREAIAVRGEQRWPVPPLDDDTAARLFVSRAMAADPRLSQSDTAPDVAEICRRLEGIPLAIELAAARLAELDLEALALSLHRVLDLAGGYRTDAPRHRAMRTLVAWSVDALAPEQRAVFRRLAPLRGLNARESAIAAARSADPSMADTEIERAVSALVAKSLVIEAEDDKLRMLDPIREYAAEVLEESGEEAAVLGGLLAWVVGRRASAMVERRDDALAVPAPLVSLDTTRVLLGWAEINDPPMLARLVVTLGGQFVRLALWEEALRWIEAALNLAPEADIALRAALFHTAALVAMHQGDSKKIQEYAEQALALAEQGLAEGAGPADSLPAMDLESSVRSAATALGSMLLQERRFDEAEAMFARSAALSPPDSASYAAALLNQATVHLGRGDVAGAEQVLEESAAIFERHPDDPHAVGALHNLSAFRGMKGDHHGAAEGLEKVIALAQGRAPSLHLLASAEVNLGIARKNVGHPEAMDTIRAGVRRAREHGDQRALMIGLRALLDTAHGAGRWNDVRRLADDVLAVASRMADAASAAYANAVLATAHDRLGDVEASRAARRAAVGAAAGGPLGGVDACGLLVELADSLAATHPEVAARLLGAAAASLPERFPVSAGYAAQEASVRDRLVGALGEQVGSLIQQGRGLDPAAALKLVGG